MFTGIVEEMGVVQQVRQSDETMVLSIEAKKVLEDVKIGDSISVNGVCLTVTSFTSSQFTVDVMPETIRATSLRGLGRGTAINLERAMQAGGRFGGHFVSGHVDGIGTIVKKVQEQNAVYYEIEVAPNLRKYMIDKGSVAVDGTSLTIFSVDETSFTISIIPHTLEQTVIGKKDVGDIVNIECDMIGKYIEQFISHRLNKESKETNELTAQFLESNGFK